MPARGTLTDRLVAWIVGSAATAMLLAGVSVILAGLASGAALGESDGAAALASILFQIGVIFIVAGAATVYLSRPSGPRLPSELAAIPEADRSAIGGWLIAQAIALIGLPVWLLIQLRPFLAEWRRVIEILTKAGIWEGANSNGAGLVLVPLAGALTPPLLELAALLAFVVASPILLSLLLSRSIRFPRLYIQCVLLLSALVIASGRGADAAMQIRAAVEGLLTSSTARPEEFAQVRNVLSRYSDIVGSTASVLWWGLCGYLVWVPALFVAPRVVTTFASASESTPAGVPDVETITTPPRFPG